MDQGAVFRGYRNERLSCYFTTPEPLDYDSVEVRIDDVPAALSSLGLAKRGLWQVNLKLNRSLSTGEHQVRLRTAGSSFSNPLTFRFVASALATGMMGA